MTEPWNVDGVVVARAIAGDRDVLDGILAALQRPLYRYISRLLTHRETTEDVLQEVLFRICKKIVWLRDPELLRPWHFALPAGNASGSCAQKNAAARKYRAWILRKRAPARASRRNGSPVSLIGGTICRQRAAPSSCCTTWRR